MIKIIFIDSEAASLPEIDAYITYFQQCENFECKRVKMSDIATISDDNYDVIWKFMGTDRVKTPKNKVVIHEYASASTGKFPKLKNLIKRAMNKKPTIRIFLNESVKNQMNFKDNVPYTYRDMGINREKQPISNKKEFEYVYVGDISRTRSIDKLLKSFAISNDRNIHLIGKVENDIFKKFSKYPNIHFEGFKSRDEVDRILGKSKYGINFIPNRYPYNFQTSTKLLEYLQYNLKVITVEYEWINCFEKNNSCNFYKINDIDQVLDFDSIEKFNFKGIENMEKFHWNKVINISGIKEMIVSKIEQN